MNCIDCIYSINEQQRCWKANPEIKSCEEYKKANRVVLKEIMEEMLE